MNRIAPDLCCPLGTSCVRDGYNYSDTYIARCDLNNDYLPDNATVSSEPTTVTQTVQQTVSSTSGEAEHPPTSPPTGRITSAPPSIPTTLSVSTSPNATSDSQSLSGGAKAGIGVGAAAVGLAALALIGFLLLKRRKRHNHEAVPTEDVGDRAEGPTQPNSAASTTGLPADEKVGTPTEPTELDASNKPVEASSMPVSPKESVAERHEMPA
ncbi:MAG: hypothetical protein Q9162_004590 [Coniocarpon cinnabarinum]